MLHFHESIKSILFSSVFLLSIEKLIRTSSPLAIQIVFYFQLNTTTRSTTNQFNKCDANHVNVQKLHLNLLCRHGMCMRLRSTNLWMSVNICYLTHHQPRWWCSQIEKKKRSDTQLAKLTRINYNMKMLLFNMFWNVSNCLVASNCACSWMPNMIAKC